MDYNILRTGQVNVYPPAGGEMVIHMTSFDSWRQGKYNYYIRKRNRALVERFGDDYWSKRDDHPDINTIVEQGWYWAFLMSCVEKAEYRPDVESEWQPCEIPANWLTMDGYISNVHPDISKEIGALGIELNPGTFGFNDTDSEKNAGVLSVRRSLN